jgi:2-polyprenyl-6-methoxyphenol hydroxylase-like FAD-dependent oxidoreductase
MPPQGESTGIAIEDGVLFAHVLSRRDSRTVSELLRDYETLRRPDINKSYQETLTRWTTMPSAATPTWYKALLFDWITWVYVMVMNWQTTDHFARDVRKVALPE